MSKTRVILQRTTVNNFLSPSNLQLTVIDWEDSLDEEDSNGGGPDMEFRGEVNGFVINVRGAKKVVAMKKVNRGKKSTSTQRPLNFFVNNLQMLWIVETRRENDPGMHQQLRAQDIAERRNIARGSSSPEKGNRIGDYPDTTWYIRLTEATDSKQHIDIQNLSPEERKRLLRDLLGDNERWQDCQKHRILWAYRSVYLSRLNNEYPGPIPGWCK